MKISYGQPDGTFQRSSGDDTCQTLVATTLDDLRDVATGRDSVLGPFTGAGTEIRLSGETAQLFSGTAFLASKPTLWVVAFHNDRPVVLEFHFTSTDPYPGLIDDIVASFVFVD